MTLTNHILDAWHLIVPPRGNPHGPLPPLLLLLTFVTGLVDAFSYLMLGHVLVANMTGNVVFLGFAVGGAPGFIWWASLLAIGTFLAGAVLGGRLETTVGHHRGRHLFLTAIAETVLVALSLLAAWQAAAPYEGWVLALLIALLGVALGLQNATARALAVPDLTTTVLTLTITGIAADSRAAGGQNSKIGRRLVPISSMFLGGLVGALLVVGGHDLWTLAVATGVLAVVVIGALGPSRSRASWVSKK
ncbi:DUF1275 domain-containing protein [Nocardioides sp. KC13]|uniref:DUF1275 domain-containing protein n=1 Tax=Nocardioides turkmenicus TaxID=2711220 RepID=A0A6M1R268_9ACTN|nr:YoaK family protein [Nocardioides sp. KC13]NGN91829.1 DUF1275 domain-containing protein [Nocardioides sp. KC13]